MIREANWDSALFKMKIGESDGEIPISDNIQSFDVIYLKSKNATMPDIAGFSNLFSETKILFDKTVKSQSEKSPDIHLFNAVGLEREHLYELAFESGKFSRFKLDKLIGTANFKALYRLWVDNSLDNELADEVLVYETDGTIAGFITYKIYGSFAVVGLIAVRPNYQGKRIGSQMVGFVENTLIQKGISKLRIPTQQSNAEACRFYQKLGYSISEITYISHYWNNQRLSYDTIQ